jgi:flotillin
LAAMESARGLAEAKVITAKAAAKKADAGAVKELGLAEADVIKAKGAVNASNTQTQAEAEAEGHKEKELAAASGIEARGLAEAKAIHQKAEAMKLFDDAGKEHEEFKLRLSKERDVELAAIHVQRDIAQANSNIVGEALKHANIDIVGGENDFFEKVVRAVGTGKAVDRMVNNSAALTDVKNTFFNGDGQYFKTQMKQWIDDFGIKSEDVKNLTIAALLGKLLASTNDSSVQTLMNSALAMVRERGMAEAPASSVVSQAALARS